MITWKCQRQRTSWILLLERHKSVYSALNLDEEVTGTLDIRHSSYSCPTSTFLRKAEHLKAKRKQPLMVLLFIYFSLNTHFEGDTAFSGQCFTNLPVHLWTVEGKKYTFYFNPLPVYTPAACMGTHTDTPTDLKLKLSFFQTMSTLTTVEPPGIF